MSQSPNLTVSMQLTDEGISKPSRKQPISLTSQIAALEPDDIATKGVQIDSESLGNLSEIKKGLSDSAYSSARAAKKRSGRENAEFSIETSHTITNSGAIYALAIIKRTA